MSVDLKEAHGKDADCAADHDAEDKSKHVFLLFRSVLAGS
jgi:hypothetical protein